MCLNNSRLVSSRLEILGKCLGGASRLFLPLIVSLWLLQGSVYSAPFSYYTGDTDSLDGLANVAGGAYANAEVYNSFSVPAGPDLKVTALFTNNIMDYTPQYADWSIRYSVFGGTANLAVSSGQSLVTPTPTGRTVQGLPEYTVAIDLSSYPVVLHPGIEYWFNVTPLGLGVGDGYSAETTTGGVTDPLYSDADNLLSFVPASSLGPSFAGSSFENFSAGLAGETVPEPSSLALMSCAAGGLWWARAALRRKRA